MYIYISMLALGFMDAAVAIRQVVNAGCAPKDLKHFEEQLGKFGGDVKMEAPQPLFVCVCVHVRAGARVKSCNFELMGPQARTYDTNKSV